MTTRKCSNVGAFGIRDRLVMISLSGLNALLMAHSRGESAKAAMARSATWDRTLGSRFSRRGWVRLAVFAREGRVKARRGLSLLDLEAVAPLIGRSPAASAS